MTASKPTRGFQISGVPLVDPKGRWYLLHATGERPLAPMELGLTQAPLADGVFFPRERGRLGSSQMALQLHVTDAGRGHGGRTQRDRNLADLYNALQAGRETTVSMMIAGQLCSQRCIVTAGSAAVEHSAGLLKVSLILTLLEGVWKAEPEEELVTGGTLATLSGCTGPARPVWSVQGPVTALEIRQGGQVVVSWGGSLPAGARLVIDGWKSWRVDGDAREWWAAPARAEVSTVQVSEAEPLLPNALGEYEFTAKLDGSENLAGKLSAYVSATYL